MERSFLSTWFDPAMPESFKSRLTKWYFNLYPAYRGTGASVTYIASDWREVRIKLPLSWRTYNLVGVIFGGSIYASVDPFYMIMLIRNLGPEYEVWDKEAHIRFRRPGRSTLRASFKITEADLEEIRRELASKESMDKEFTIELMDKSGVVHAIIQKTIYIAHKARGE